jgi:hypothetical protein
MSKDEAIRHLVRPLSTHDDVIRELNDIYGIPEDELHTLTEQQARNIHEALISSFTGRLTPEGAKALLKANGYYDLPSEREATRRREVAEVYAIVRDEVDQHNARCLLEGHPELRITVAAFVADLNEKWLREGRPEWILPEEEGTGPPRRYN